MSNITTGNAIGPLDSLSRNSAGVMPGYQFCKATGYIALTPTPGNRFPVWEATEKPDDPSRLLTVPKGARIYSIGFRTGEGFVNRLGGDRLQLTAVNPITGIQQPAINQVFATLRNSSFLVSTAAPGSFSLQKHPTGKLENKVLPIEGGSNDSDAMHSVSDPWSVATGSLFEAINNYLAINSSFSDDLAVMPEFAKPGATFEIQLITGSALADLAVSGLTQSLDPLRKNKGYAIVDIGYILKDWRVTDPDDLGISWDEVFKHVF